MSETQTLPDPPGTYTEDKNLGGRPSAYREEFVEQAEKLCNLGATDEEMADFFGISVRTLYRWKIEQPTFCQSIKNAKEVADERVERSLYQMATGFIFKQQEAIKVKDEQYKEHVEVVDVDRFNPPEAPAAIFWLKNRRKEQWRDKQEHELTGIIKTINANVDVNNMTPEVLDALEKALLLIETPAEPTEGGEEE